MATILKSSHTIVKRITLGTPIKSVSNSGLALNIQGDSGTADAITTGSNEILTISGDGTITTSTEFNSSTIGISVRSASADSIGVASFDANNFTVTDGHVTLNILDSNSEVTGSLIPALDTTYDLGTAEKKWKDLHLSGTTIFLGGIKLQDSNGTFAVKDSNGFPVPIDLSAITTDDVAEGTSNIYYTTARFDSDLTSSASASTIRTYIEAGNGVYFNSETGVISIGQPVDSTSDVFFNNITANDITAQNTIILGNLTVQGTTTTVNSTEVTINDKNLTLADSALNSLEIDGGGITLGGGLYDGTQPSLTYAHAGKNWYSNVPLSVSGSLTADSSTVTNLTSDSADIRNLSVDDINVQTANVDSATITNLSGTNITYDTATISQADFDSAHIEIVSSTTADIITANIGTSNITIANIDSAVVTDLVAMYGRIESFTSTNATIANGNIDSSDIRNLSVDNINANQVEIDSASVTNFTATSYILNTGNINSATIGTANVTTLTSDSGTITDLTATNIVGTTGLIDSAAITNLAVTTFNLGTGIADSAVITGLSGTTANFTNIVRSGATNYAGTWGTASSIPVLTLDASGFVDSIGTVSVAGVTNFVYDSGNGQLTISTADGNSFVTTVTLDPFNTSTLAEGTNLYYTTARADSDAKNSVSATDNGGDGSFTYNSSTGVFTYTGPSATEVRAHFSGGTGVTITDGVVAIGQPVAVTDSARFAALSTDGDLVVGGDLIVQGTTTTVNSTEVSIADKNINVASNATNNTLADGAGLTVGDSSYSGATITYDGVSDRWDFNKDIEVDTVYAKLISDSATVTNIAISDANIVSANIDSATITNIAVASANIGNAELDSASITNLAVTTFNLGVGVADSAVITGLSGTTANFTNLIRSGATSYAGTWGSASTVPVITVDASGFIDSIGSVSVAGVTGFTYDSSNGNLTITTADGGSFTDNINFSPFTTSDLAEGNNLYYTTVRADSDFDVRLTTKSTTNVAEGTNLYYTKARVDSDVNEGFVTRTTTNLTEGDNLYYTTARADSDFDTRLATKSTTDVAEGSNLYYTTARADSDFDTRLTTKSTTDVAEGSNLYYTTARADSDFDVRLITKSTTDLTEGSNLYYTTARADSDFDTRLATKSTTDVAEGDNLYYTTARADSDAKNAISGAGDISYDPVTGIISIDVEQIYTKDNFDSDLNLALSTDAVTTTDLTEGDNLYYTKARVDSDVNEGFVTRTTTDVAEGSNLYYTKARVDSDVNEGFTTRTTDNLTEGSNLYYTTARFDSDFNDNTTTDLTEGSNLYYTTARADSDFDVRLAIKSTTDLTEGNNLYYTTARADSDFDVRLATKTTDNLTEGDNLYYTTARADSDFDVRLVTKSTDNLTEGDNLYYTTARADSDFDTRLTTKTTSDLGEGVNLYYTTDRADSDAKNAISVTDAGGDGSLSYNNLTGTITYTGPSASEARAHFSGGTGVSITDGVVAIGQPVATTSDVTFNNISADGYVDFKHDSATSPAHSEGRVYYSQEYKTLTVLNDISDVALQVGREEWMRGYNNTGSTITNGTPVYITGAAGETPTIAPADASVEGQAYVIGVATNDILDASEGEVTTFGLVSGINTSNLVSGGLVHLAPGGGLQQNAATYPYYPTEIGTCITSDSSDGYLLVTVRHHTFERFRVTGNQFIGGDLTVNGNLTVSGTQSVVNQANLAVDTAFIYSNSGNTISTPTFTGSGLNDIVFVGHYNGTTSKTYYVRIDGVGTGTGGADTFEWSYDNFSTTEATGLDCTTAPFELEDNIQIDFNSTTGHTLNDAWSAAVAPVNVDAGFASNRNTGTSGVGYTHMGAFFDVTDEKWKFFKSYRPEPEGTIDTTDSSYEKATIDANLTGNVTGNLTGNVTGNASTATALATSRNFSASGDASASAVGFTGAANVNLALTLATVNANVGTFGSGTQVPVITVNGKGLITSVTTSTIAGVTGVTYDSSNGDLTISTTGGDFTDNINLNPFSTTDLAEGNNLYYTTDRADSDFDTRLATKTTTDLGEGNNLYYTTARADSDFDTRLTTKTTDNLTEGDNLYYTTARFDSDFGENTTDDLTEGSTNLYYTQARADSDAKNAISITDAGGDGSLSYNPTTGEITYTGPSASEVRAHFSASGDLSYSSETGIFSFSETYSTANELLTAIKTVDGAASGLDADLLDGQHGSYYRIDVYDATGTLLN